MCMPSLKELETLPKGAKLVERLIQGWIIRSNLKYGSVRGSYQAFLVVNLMIFTFSKQVYINNSALTTTFYTYFHSNFFMKPHSQ